MRLTVGRNSTGARSSGPRLGTYAASPRTLARATFQGGPLVATSEARMARVRELRDRGAINSPSDRPTVVVRRDGSLEVESGRHRILAAREAGIPLIVRFVRGGGRR